jgi:hypothetical protein
MEHKTNLARRASTATIWHIVIEGHDARQMEDFFYEIQNKYNLYDNCVLEECQPAETIIDDDRYTETGHLTVHKKLIKQHRLSPKS